LQPERYSSGPQITKRSEFRAQGIRWNAAIGAAIMLRLDLDHCEWLPDDTKTGEMVFIPGATFRMGSDHHYPEEAPSHRVSVDGFWIDRTPVTNSQFAQFVDATGYVTEAQIMPDAGSLVFSPLPRITDLTDWRQLWNFMRGADWRHPCGPDSNIEGLDDHPVVHVACSDAAAYARWAGKDLPTEAEWEFAARGGLEGAEFAWGDALMPGGRPMANIWQGNFPVRNPGADGSTSPVTSFPPNGYGLYDMIGNVWEWTSDWWSARHPADVARPRRIPRNPRGASAQASCDPAQPGIPRKVLKGGSHLCAPNYCRRYRPAARHAEPVDTSSSQVGFRCVARQPGYVSDAAVWPFASIWREYRTAPHSR
jgi:formylglycine-generating enzyme required for sulfatase activity